VSVPSHLITACILSDIRVISARARPSLPMKRETGYSEHKIRSSHFILVSQNQSVSYNRKWQPVQHRTEVRQESCGTPAICMISRLTQGPIGNLNLLPVSSDPAPHERRSYRSGSQQRPTCNRSDRSESFVGPTLSRSTRFRGVDRARADRLHTLGYSEIEYSTTGYTN
jgi:hypothetical protein